MSISANLTNLINKISSNMIGNQLNIKYLYDSLIYYLETELSPALIFTYNVSTNQFKFVTPGTNNTSVKQIFHLQNLILTNYISLINACLFKKIRR